MQFNFAGVFLSSYMLIFLSVSTGLIFGNIKFGKFKFSLSGALFTALIIGWLAYGYSIDVVEGDTAYSAAQKLISDGVVPSNLFTIFLILFVAAVGLLAAKDMGVVLKKYGVKFVILGVVITATSAAATNIGARVLPGTNTYEMSGVYTGALTSSPGLAAAIETSKSYSSEVSADYENLEPEAKVKYLEMVGIEDVNIDNVESFEVTDEMKNQYALNAEASIGAGYAVAYPFGVLIVILAVNFFPVIFRLDVEKERLTHKREMEEARKTSSVKEIKSGGFDILAFFVTCGFGYILGSINVYMPIIGYVSLGSTGGVLIGGLILGYIGKIGSMNFRMDTKVLGAIRDISLAFFLSIVGLRYGYKAIDAVLGSGMYLALTSVVVGTVGMLIGFAIGKYVFKINWLMLSGAICGGMTSTPGLGAAIEAAGGDEPAGGYGATYPFALLGMVIFTIILQKLPV